MPQFPYVDSLLGVIASIFVSPGVYGCLSIPLGSSDQNLHQCCSLRCYCRIIVIRSINMIGHVCCYISSELQMCGFLLMLSLISLVSCTASQELERVHVCLVSINAVWCVLVSSECAYDTRLEGILAIQILEYTLPMRVTHECPPSYLRIS